MEESLTLERIGVSVFACLAMKARLREHSVYLTELGLCLVL